MRIKILMGFVFAICLLSTPFISRSESEIGVYDSDIYIETVPENPEPYQDVTVTVSSYATDLNKAMIEWRSGTNLLISGYGKTSYSLKVFGPNTSTVVDVTITPEGMLQKINKRIIINPTEVDMFWEAVDGYTPPFYKGKSFVSTEGSIKVIAIPNLSGFSNKSAVVYKWKNEDNSVVSASGYDKNYYIFPSSTLSLNEKISVSVSSLDGGYSATKDIGVPIVSPKILFYKKSPTEGVLYNYTLNDDSFFTESEVTVVAEPYFLALKGNENLFTYDWSINGEKINTPNKKTELTIRPTSRDGYATINLVLENFNTLFQKVSGSLRLNF